MSYFCCLTISCMHILYSDYPLFHILFHVFPIIFIIPPSPTCLLLFPRIYNYGFCFVAHLVSLGAICVTIELEVFNGAWQGHQWVYN